MPTLMTKGTMSAQSLGLFASQGGGGVTSNWIGIISGITFGTSSGASIRVDSSNNIYIGYGTNNRESGISYFAKINTTPSIDWQYNVSGLLLDNAGVYANYSCRPVAVDASGNWFAVGSGFLPDGNNINQSQANVTKYNNPNFQVWNMSANDLGQTVRSYGLNAWPDASGNLILSETYECVQPYPPSTPSYTGYLETSITKRDVSSGAEIWNLNYRADAVNLSNASGLSVCNVSNMDSLGNFYGLFYQETSFPASVPTGKLCKFNSSGTLLWTKDITYSGSSFRVIDVKCNASGQVACILSASTTPAMMVFDASGTLLWQKWFSFGGAKINANFVDNSGNVYATGINNTDVAFFVTKFDSTGSILWNKVFNNNNVYTIGQDIVLDGNNNICACGYTTDGAGNDQIMLMSLPNGGPVDGTYNVGGFDVIVYDNTDVATTSPFSIASGSMITSPYVVDYATNPLSTSALSKTFNEAPL